MYLLCGYTKFSYRQKLKSLDEYKQIAYKNAWDLAPYLFSLCQ